MEHLMQANLQVIELLGAVFEEVERQGRVAAHRPARPRMRAWVGRTRPSRDIAASHAQGTN